MKAYCINLDSRSDRLDYIIAEFGRHGMAFERIAAIDGKAPAIIAAAQNIPAMWTGRKMSAGAYACLQSHRKAWQLLVASGANHAMVFEDDLQLADGVAAYLDDDWVPADADVVKLETFSTRTHLEKIAVATVGGRKLFRLRSTHIGAGAYVLSFDTARRLLDATETCGDPIDEVIFNDSLSVFPTLKIYQMFPAPAIQGKRTEANVAEPWAGTSLEQRVESGSDGKGIQHESMIARLFRRAREELRGKLQGTVYVVVPHE